MYLAHIKLIYKRTKETFLCMLTEKKTVFIYITIWIDNNSIAEPRKRLHTYAHNIWKLISQILHLSALNRRNDDEKKIKAYTRKTIEERETYVLR